MNFPNLGPLCHFPRPKMMRISWTLRGRLQYILVKGLLQKKMIIIKLKVYLACKHTSECLDPQFQKYHHKLIFKQCMCEMINISYT